MSSNSTIAVSLPQTAVGQSKNRACRGSKQIQTLPTINQYENSHATSLLQALETFAAEREARDLMLQNVSDPDVIAAKLVTSTKRSGGGVGTLNLTPVSQPADLQQRFCECTPTVELHCSKLETYSNAVCAYCRSTHIVTRTIGAACQVDN